MDETKKTLLLQSEVHATPYLPMTNLINISMQQNIFLLLLLIVSGACSRGLKQTDTSLYEKMQGAWCTVNAPGYCTIQIDRDSLIWVDVAPEHWYAYSMVGDTIKTYNPYDANMMSEPVRFCGDTLIIGNGNIHNPALKLLPFATISIGGKRIKIPHTAESIWEERLNGIMESLMQETLDEKTLNEWNTLALFTDGCTSETCTGYLADLYMKHPQIFLTWIYNQRMTDEDSYIKRVVIGGGEEIIGYPNRERVLHDMNQIEDVDKKQYLKKLLHDWIEF